MCWTTKKSLVLIGDAGCGKTSLAVKLSQDLFLDDYFPTDFDDFSAEINTKRGSCKLTMLDTSGTHEQSEIRSQSYKGCDAVVVCFDLTNMASLASVESMWLPELRKHCPGTPFIIAGLKRDDMCDGVGGCECGGNCCTVSEEELTAIISRTGAAAYIECSALTSENVEEVFSLAVDATPRHRRMSGAKKIVSSLKKKLSVSHK